MDPTAKFQPVVWTVPEAFHILMQRGMLPIEDKIRVRVQFHSHSEVSMWIEYGGAPFLVAHHVDLVKDACLGFDLPPMKLSEIFKREGGLGAIEGV